MDEVFEIMKADELCQYLRVNIRSLPKLIKQGLPFFTVGESERGHKRFKKSDVDEWISRSGSLEKK